MSITTTKALLGTQTGYSFCPATDGCHSVYIYPVTPFKYGVGTGGLKYHTFYDYNKIFSVNHYVHTNLLKIPGW